MKLRLAVVIWGMIRLTVLVAAAVGFACVAYFLLAELLLAVHLHALE
ncbi:hypothetical protein ISN76_02740 [Dyella halodurans]|uniref:Uncharacterized protein n=1 Tax=Dyella halodurans TaxID=1920171 RepID=A0ABV9BWY4_9GAMM|nr:hypothetical protein [Dyella halodurans]